MSTDTLTVLVLTSLGLSVYFVWFGRKGADLIATVLFLVFVLTLAIGHSRVNAGTLGMHAASWHSEPGFNNTNPGAYYVADNGATVGAYCNSESRSELFPNAKVCQVSAYTGYTASADFGPLNAAVTVGVITGYQRGTAPMVLPTLSLADNLTIAGVNIGKPRVAFIPKIDPKRGAHVVHLAWEVKF